MRERTKAMTKDRRERVEQAILQLGYRPNTAARSLVTRRSATIGVIEGLGIA